MLGDTAKPSATSCSRSLDQVRSRFSLQMTCQQACNKADTLSASHHERQQGLILDPSARIPVHSHVEGRAPQAPALCKAPLRETRRPQQERYNEAVDTCFCYTRSKLCQSEISSLPLAEIRESCHKLIYVLTSTFLGSGSSQ